MTDGSDTPDDAVGRMTPVWNTAVGVLVIRPSGVGETMSPRDGAVTAIVGAALLVPLLWIQATQYLRFLLMLGAIALPLGCGMLALSLLAGAGHRRAAKDCLRRTAVDSWEGLARRAWAAARLKSVWTWRSDPRRAVHEAEWFGGRTPAGETRPRPTVILSSCAEVAFPVIVGGEDVSESVEVGVARRLAPGEQRRRVRQLTWLLGSAAVVGILFERVGISLHFWFVWLMGNAVLVMYRLGWGPIALNSSIASIGSLEVTRWGTRSSYTSSDSVLVIDVVNLHAAVIRSEKGSGDSARRIVVRRAAEQVRVHAVRRDGRISSLKFDGTEDPGLSDLLSRWLHGGIGGDGGGGADVPSTAGGVSDVGGARGEPSGTISA
jgi:hypothetical protein